MMMVIMMVMVKIMRKYNFGYLSWNIVIVLPSVFWEAYEEIYIIPNLFPTLVDYACCINWSETLLDWDLVLTDSTKILPLILAFHNNGVIWMCSIRICSLFCQVLIRKINSITKVVSWGLYLKINLFQKLVIVQNYCKSFVGPVPIRPS